MRLGKLDMNVVFYGVENCPPNAMHSEGHQDSMGICLYLTLSEHLNQGIIDLIILDDFGLEIMDYQSRLILFELIEDRHGEKSIIIASQLPIKNWHEVIKDPTIADAICDRIVHRAYKIDLQGESLRKLKEKS